MILEALGHMDLNIEIFLSILVLKKNTVTRTYISYTNETCNVFENKNSLSLKHIQNRTKEQHQDINIDESQKNPHLHPCIFILGLNIRLHIYL